MSDLKEIHKAVVLHEGWEMDNEMWVMEDSKGKRFAFTTSHGGRCKMSMTSIEDHIKETKLSLDGLEKAKKLLLEQKGDK